jgi:hypothetical protein
MPSGSNRERVASAFTYGPLLISKGGMMDDQVECTACLWSGLSDELVCTDDDEDNFNHCPQCGSDGIVDLGYEEDED